MITDEQVNAFINAFYLNGGHFLGNNEFDNVVRKALEAYEQSKWIDIKNKKPSPRQIVMNSNDVLAYWEDNKWKGVDGFIISPNAKYWQPLPEFKE